MQPRPSVPEPPQYAPQVRINILFKIIIIIKCYLWGNQTRTAKKISNISSINFLNSTRNKKKDSYA